MKKHWVAALFAKFQARFGHKWTSAVEGIEDVAVTEWADGMAGLTADHIKLGLETWQEPWPPSLPEFVSACTGRHGGKNEFGMDYVPEFYRVQPIRDKSRLLSSGDRDKRREAATGHINSLREVLGASNSRKP